VSCGGDLGVDILYVMILTTPGSLLRSNCSQITALAGLLLLLLVVGSHHDLFPFSLFEFALAQGNVNPG
jgi:hypothetical protein